MLALLNFFQTRYAGWKQLIVPEGVKLLFPENPMHKLSASQSPLGQIKVSLYSASLPQSGYSTILCIRDYDAEELLEAKSLFNDWKCEFVQTMEAAGIKKFLVREKCHGDVHPTCDMLLSDAMETSFTRVRLVAQGNRLIVLFAVGNLQEVSSPAVTESFSSMRVR
ncbi:MAG: hypothetical protein U0796_17320 [Gemmatales bacterium]